MMLVLLVDSEQSLLETAKAFMQKDGGIKADTATSAKLALSLIEKSGYDVIVSEYELSDMNGIELLKAVRSRKDNVPFIIFTGKGDEAVAIDALNSGADYYLKKGDDPKSELGELVRMITQAVSSRGFRPEAEEKLAESEKRYKTVFENTGAGVIVIENDMTVSMSNTEFVRMSGFSMGEILGHKFTDFVPREEIPRLASYHRQRRKDEAIVPRNYELTLNTKSGKPKKFHVTVSIIPGTERSIASFLDITQRVQAEKDAREAERFMDSVFSSIQDGISILDRDLKILKVNTTMERWYAHNMPLVGRRCHEAYQNRSEPCAVCPTLQTLKTGKVAVEIVPKVGPEGRQVGWLELYSFPQLNPVTGDLDGVIEYVRDVSDRKSYEDALKQANEKLNLMGNVTRHDALNQIGILSGWLSIAMDSTDDKDMREYLKRIGDAANMIRSQLEFTADYQEMGIRGPVWIGVDTAFSRGVAGLRFGDIAVALDLKGIDIYADPMVDKVFHNLADNSIRHGGKLTKIEVWTERSGEELRIVYSDDGQGIPQGEKAKIFYHGYGKNTGYGLYMARAILGITNITIDEIGEPGVGAKFVITVPPQKFRVHDRGA